MDDKTLESLPIMDKIRDEVRDMGEIYQSIVDAVAKHASDRPDKLAVADETGAYSYKELYDQSIKTAAALQGRGIGQGNVVVVECTQDRVFIQLDLACELVGAVFVPVEGGVQTAKLQEICEAAEAAILIADRQGVSACLTIRPQELTGVAGERLLTSCAAKSEAVAEVLFSTGTTGKPKGVILSNGANVAVAENIIHGTGMSENSVELIPLPLSHSHGLRTCYAHLVNGSTAVIAKGVSNTGAFFELMGKYGVNALDLAPTMAKLLLQIGRQKVEEYQAQIEYIELGTALLEEDVKAELKKCFPGARIYNFYGSTEAGRSCILNITQEDFANCVGYPSCHASFVITDDKRQVIKSSKDHMGLLAIRGKMMMNGYLNSPEMTAETLDGDLLYTSDMGYIDDDGRVYVMGRADDVINYNGIKVVPTDIERVARNYEGIKDCVCVGVPDKVCGHRPKLYVELSTETFDLKEFKIFLRQKLEASRIHVAVEVLDSIPRSSNGKILRAELQKK